MQTKVYFASSVPAALEVARQEIGEEAMLVASRPAPPQMREYGRLEVTFAWNPPAPAEPPPQPPESRISGSEIDDVLQQLAALRQAVGGQSKAQPARRNRAAEKLRGNGFSRELALEIASALPDDSDDHAIVAELTRRIPRAAGGASQPHPIAFIGPPGRGKTTSLVKFAMTFGLARRVPVRIYTAGTHAIGAREQMARYAAILGTPWQACESLASLDLVLNGDSWKGLVLIDTPGISPAEKNELSEFNRFFGAHPEIERHLTLRASATSADMLLVIARFSSLAPTRLLFTGLDEISSSTPMTETLIRCGIPAALGGTGQQIPDDLTEMDAERLARSALTGDTACLITGDNRFRLAAA